MKKLIIIVLAVVLMIIFAFPGMLSADPFEGTITIEKSATGFNSGEFEFTLYIRPGLNWVQLGIPRTIDYNGGTDSWVIGTALDPLQLRVVESGINGATGVMWNLCFPPTAINGVVDDTASFELNSSSTTVTIYFDNIKKGSGSKEPEPTQVRTMPLTCNQVWINEDNCFEFVFWYEYADNNWVKIYNMAGVEVFSIDMPHGKASFEANLPDGMYTVKTFHEAGHILQEFVIGKP